MPSRTCQMLSQRTQSAHLLSRLSKFTPRHLLRSHRSRVGRSFLPHLPPLRLPRRLPRIPCDIYLRGTLCTLMVHRHYHHHDHHDHDLTRTSPLGESTIVDMVQDATWHGLRAQGSQPHLVQMAIFSGGLFVDCHRLELSVRCCQPCYQLPCDVTTSLRSWRTGPIPDTNHETNNSFDAAVPMR